MGKQGGVSVNQGKGELYGTHTHTHCSGSHTLQVRSGQNPPDFSHQHLPQQLLFWVLPTPSYLLGENATRRMGGPGLQYRWGCYLILISPCLRRGGPRGLGEPPPGSELYPQCLGQCLAGTALKRPRREMKTHIPLKTGHSMLGEEGQGEPSGTRCS